MDADKARRTLTEERDRLTELASWNREQMPETSVQQEGAMGQHPGDYGSEVEETMERQGQADESDRQRAEIEDALARIENGSWGRCAVCGKDIDDERLEARPQVNTCREHADAA
jgi:RNA polymerase-binding transcription factor DksA